MAWSNFTSFTHIFYDTVLHLLLGGSVRLTLLTLDPVTPNVLLLSDLAASHPHASAVPSAGTGCPSPPRVPSSGPWEMAYPVDFSKNILLTPRERERGPKNPQ